MSSNKESLIKQYKPLKIMSYCLASFWLTGVLLIIIGLFLTMTIGFTSVQNSTDNSPSLFNNSTSNKSGHININGIIFMSVFCSIGILFSIGSQIVIPILMKKNIKKNQDKNYSILLKFVSVCHMSPVNGSLSIIKQINWIINFDETQSLIINEVNEQIKKETENKELSRLEKQKIEQEKLDLIYKKENDELKKENKKSKPRKTKTSKK